MENFNLQIAVNNSAEVLKALETQCAKALEECGLIAEGYAKEYLKYQKAVDTGNLRNSVTHSVDTEKRIMRVGTNSEYAVYVEMGTGKYITGGSPPWVYVDDEGNFHRTEGQPARPFIKPAIADHEQEYRQIIDSELKG